MKKTILLATLMLTSVAVSAQTGFGRAKKPKQNAFTMSIKAGGTMSTMTQPDECDLYDGSGFGYVGGLSFNIRFDRASKNANAGTGMLALGLDLQYKLNSMKTIGTDQDGKENANLELGYFEAPIYLQLYPFYKNSSANTFYVEAGAAIAGTMSRKPETLTVSGNDNVVYIFDKDGSKLKGMDVRPFAGVGYSIPNTGLGLGARYYLGTSKLAENFNSKISNVEFSLFYKFNVGKF